VSDNGDERKRGEALCLTDSIVAWRVAESTVLSDVLVISSPTQEWQIDMALKFEEVQAHF
jgi:hypothetical protein